MLISQAGERVPLSVFDQPAVNLPEEFGADLSSIGQFDIRLSGTLPGNERFYIAKNEELLCVTYGKGASAQDLEGGLFCNTPENTLKLGLYTVRTYADGSVRTIALLPDGCNLDGKSDARVQNMTNLGVLDGDQGVISCTGKDPRKIPILVGKDKNPTTVTPSK